MTSRKIDRLEIRKDEGQRRNCNLVNNEPRENHASSTFSPMIAVRGREKLADELLDARRKKNIYIRERQEFLFQSLFFRSFDRLSVDHILFFNDKEFLEFLRQFYFCTSACNVRYSLMFLINK